MTHPLLPLKYEWIVNVMNLTPMIRFHYIKKNEVPKKVYFEFIQRRLSWVGLTYRWALKRKWALSEKGEFPCWFWRNKLPPSRSLREPLAAENCPWLTPSKKRETLVLDNHNLCPANNHKASDENTAKLTPWFQPGETLSREPGHVMAGLLIYRTVRW